MSEKEKKIAEKLAAACEQLPEGKKEFLIGYAEGVAAMAAKQADAAQGLGMVPGPAEKEERQDA